MKDERGQRGKSAEAIVQGILDKWNEDFLGFCYIRLPDARSSMGRAKAMPCDYLLFANRICTPLEVKEIAHDYLLPSKNLSQLPTLKKLELAGSLAWVLVHHSKTDLWRCIPTEMFEIGKPSWDLRVFTQSKSAEEALAFLQPTPEY